MSDEVVIETEVIERTPWLLVVVAVLLTVAMVAADIAVVVWLANQGGG